MTGCLGNQISPVSIHSDPRGTRASELGDAPCGHTVRADREAIAPGEIVYVEAATRNCGILPFAHEEDSCGPTFEHEGARWRIDLAARQVDGCEDDTTDGYLRPGATRSSIREWNGTLLTDGAYRDAPSGEYVLWARGIAATATVRVVEREA